ncbi:M6 family metalloprotease domain-containing protein [Candidatus Sumerlaeota bacterium]|nr:M6 family metalloprotease domain-containing protein [Candidatus Sumerlaeota bacterium]
MRTGRSVSILAFLVTAFVSSSQVSGLADSGIRKGVPAYPGLVTHTQPDGTVLKVRQYGDEAYHWMETDDGYPIKLNEATGFYEYLRLNKDGAFEPAGLIVGRDNPAAAGLGKRARESQIVIEGKRRLRESKLRPPDGQMPKPLVFPTSGIVPILVLLVNYSDTTPTVSPQSLTDIINSLNPTTPSVRQYYREVSYGQLDIQARVVPQWLTVARLRADYGRNDPRTGDDLTTGPPTLLRDALDALWVTSPPLVASWYQQNFPTTGTLGPTIVIHAGGGEEFSGNPNDIWSHYSSLNQPYAVDSSSPSIPRLGISVQEYIMVPELLQGQITTIGVLVHEMGHGFGLPDLHDTISNIAVVGDWCLMCSGSWNGLRRPGNSPAHPCAWAKMQLGWMTATAGDGRLILAPRPSDFVLPAEVPIAGALGSVRRINMGRNPNSSLEYLLLESRQGIGFDRSLPGYGLLVWHIDDRIGTWRIQDGVTLANNDVNAISRWGRPRVALLQADGRTDLEDSVNQGDGADPFPGTSGNKELGPWSDYDGNYYIPNTNSYMGIYDDIGDTNIWIRNIAYTSPTLTFSVRFYPNLYISNATQIVLPTSATRFVTFSNGTARRFLAPGDPISYTTFIWNRENNYPNTMYCEDAPAAWLEFWACRTNLTFDYLALPSKRTGTIALANNQVFSTTGPLSSIPDGSYILTMALDRPNEVRESTEKDNRLWPLSQKFLVLRPETNADLVVENFSFSPQLVHNGDPIAFSGRVANRGTERSGPFWIEFWGSPNAADKYYPTLEFYLCNSIYISNLQPGGFWDLSNSPRTLSVPPYVTTCTMSVLCYADRSDQVNEKNETNNYQVVGPVGFSTAPTTYTEPASLAPVTPLVVKEESPRSMVVVADPGRLAALPDLTVRSSTVTATGLAPPSSLQINMTVANIGGTTAPASWTRVRLSTDKAASADDYVWISGAYVPALPAGAAYSSWATLGPPALTSTTLYMLTECDAFGNVAESNEKNNFFLAGMVINGVDLALDSFTYTEMQARTAASLNTRFSEPRSSVTLTARVANRGILPASRQFWLEFWGSRCGGLTLDCQLFTSRFIPALGPLSSYDIFDVWPLGSVTEGRYTVTAVVDRLQDVAEVFEANNRWPVPDKRLTELRPVRAANLQVVQFQFPDSIGRNRVIKWNGSIINSGDEYSGPFWIEFWASYPKALATMDFMLCDSILIETLRPGQQVFLLPYQRILYNNVPTGTFTVFCVVDRLDGVSEWNETDNFKSVSGVKITP